MIINYQHGTEVHKDFHILVWKFLSSEKYECKVSGDTFVATADDVVVTSIINSYEGPELYRPRLYKKGILWFKSELELTRDEFDSIYSMMRGLKSTYESMRFKLGRDRLK